MKSRKARAATSVISLLIAVGLVVALPYLVGIEWSQIWDQFAMLRPHVLLWLVFLWILGLFAYSFVLTGSLPGLNNAQGMVLNTTTSALSNLLPFGGAAGVALTFGMARSWGFRNHAILVSTLVSGVYNILARLLLPAIGLVALLATGHLPKKSMSIATAIASVALLACVAALIAALRWEAAGQWLAHWLDKAATLIPRKWRPKPHRAAEGMHRLREAVNEVFQRSWAKLSFGMAGYMALQLVLLGACLKVTGAYLGVAATLAAFALSRVLTAVVLTPGGFGFTEAGTATLLVSMGAPPAPVAAGVLLFAMFTYILEIPLGAMGWTLWLAVRRWRRPIESNDTDQMDIDTCDLARDHRESETRPT